MSFPGSVLFDELKTHVQIHIPLEVLLIIDYSSLAKQNQSEILFWKKLWKPCYSKIFFKEIKGVIFKNIWTDNQYSSYIYQEHPPLSNYMFLKSVFTFKYNETPF